MLLTRDIPKIKSHHPQTKYKEVHTRDTQRHTQVYIVCVYIPRTQRNNSKKGLVGRLSNRIQGIKCDKEFILY